MSDKNGGPAFPSPVPLYSRTTQNGLEITSSIDACGMSLRDYFAAAAMQGIIASGRTIPSAVENGCQAEIDARTAYFFADAMLAAREAKP